MGPCPRPGEVLSLKLRGPQCGGSWEYFSCGFAGSGPRSTRRGRAGGQLVRSGPCSPLSLVPNVAVGRAPASCLPGGRWGGLWPPNPAAQPPHPALVHPGPVHLCPRSSRPQQTVPGLSRGPSCPAAGTHRVSAQTGPSLQGQALLGVKKQDVWWVRGGRVGCECVSGGPCGPHRGRRRQPLDTAALLLDGGHVTPTLGTSRLPPFTRCPPGGSPTRLASRGQWRPRGPATCTDGGVTACAPQAQGSPWSTPAGLGRSTCCACSPAPGDAERGPTRHLYPQGSQLVGTEHEGQL